MTTRLTRATLNGTVLTTDRVTGCDFSSADMTDVQWLGERSTQGIHIAPAAGFIECAHATSTVVSLAKGPVGDWCTVILVIPGVETGTWTLSASHRIFLDFRRGGRAFDNQMGTLTCTRAGNMITLTGPGGMAYLPCVLSYMILYHTICY
ncbi:hypothetical protein KIPB_013822 [Kipferlia bialata]|uniref:Uncharacterized protein n=1 Tax=Kipferlia bialata TaxID=797122 RepID=A0A9K3DA06_9EUKA|nr:hypothetical protein KIPB_013822 [Kipferlia bialata]|eukprot:g13822.t1